MEKVILAIAILVIFGGFYFLYVSLITKKNKVQEAMAGIDVQLKRRYDVLPNILQLAAQFMDHESALLKEIVSLRVEAMKNSFKANPKDSINFENLLDQKLHDFWVSVESYPELKSNQTMLQAMQSFNEIEEHIAASRRFYNSSVNELKNAVEIFPGNLVASLIGVRADMPYYEAEQTAKDRIVVNDYFKK